MAAVRRRLQLRRLKLQADYGRAVMWSKGFAAEETEAAFARASELSLANGEHAERLHGLLRAVDLELHAGRIELGARDRRGFPAERKPRVAEAEAALARRALDRPVYCRANSALAVAISNARWPTCARTRHGSAAPLRQRYRNSGDGLLGVGDVAFGRGRIRPGAQRGGHQGCDMRQATSRRSFTRYLVGHP